MKRLIILGMLFTLALALTACGGGSANVSSNVVQPGPNAPVISPDEYINNYQDSDHFLLDVRTLDEFNRGKIPGATLIPLSDLPARASQSASSSEGNMSYLPEDKSSTIVVYCNSGNRSRRAVQILRDAGYENLLDLGGIQQWRAAGQQLVPPDA